jgi:RimJ/RimL family protein N-acetyltransferase
MHTFPATDLAGASDALLTHGGAAVTLRVLREEDADALQAYFRGLSPRSRYNRLTGAASELPARLLDAFTHQRDDGRLSVLATIRVDGAERIIGEARYAFDHEAASVELGLSVADAWQGQGLGMGLIANLQSRAAALGAGTLFGDTLRSNDPMQALARKAGFKFAPTPGDWRQVRFEKRIDAHCHSGAREQSSSEPGIPIWADEHREVPGSRSAIAVRAPERQRIKTFPPTVGFPVPSSRRCAAAATRSNS